VLRAVVSIIKTLREKGATSSEDLMDGLPRRTFYRALDALKNANVVLEDGGLYRWCETPGDNVYASEYEAEKALFHSRNLLAGLRSLVTEGRVSLDTELSTEEKDREYSLAHLRTGYQEISDDYNRAEHLKKRIGNKEEELGKRIGEESLKAMPKHWSRSTLVHVLAGNVVSDIKEALRGHDASFVLNLSTERGETRSNPYVLGPAEAYETLRKLILDQERSEENLRICRAIIELENKYYPLRRRLQEQVRTLVMQVENGSPLRGHCSLCSTIRILKK